MILQNGILADSAKVEVDETTEIGRTIAREVETGIETATTIEKETRIIDPGNQRIATDKTVRTGPPDRQETIVIATTTVLVGKNRSRRKIVRMTTPPAAAVTVAVDHRTIREQDQVGPLMTNVDQIAVVEASKPLQHHRRRRHLLQRPNLPTLKEIMNCADRAPLRHRRAVASRPHKVDTRLAMVAVAMAVSRMPTRMRRRTTNPLTIVPRTMVRMSFISGSAMLEVATAEEARRMCRRQAW